MALFPSAIINTLLQSWHKMLSLPRKASPAWHRVRLREELFERRTAKSCLQHLSETSDVLFTISRSRFDGFPIRSLPHFVTSRHLPAYAFMIAKYTLRWGFYQTAAWLCGMPNYRTVREVVNPQKDYKLDEVATRHGIDVMRFRRVAVRLRHVWPLLP